MHWNEQKNGQQLWCLSPWWKTNRNIPTSSRSPAEAHWNGLKPMDKLIADDDQISVWVSWWIQTMLRRLGFNDHANSMTFCHKVEDFQQTLRTSKCDWPWVLFKNVESRSPVIFQVQYSTECPHKSWELVSSDWFLAWSTNSSSSTGDVWNLLNQLFARIEENWLFLIGERLLYN